MRKNIVLVLIATCCLAESAAAVQVANVRVTTGLLGSVRKEKKFLPGDILVINFDIKNLKVDKPGSVVYKTTMQVFDQQGKEVFKQDLQPKKVLLLGGNSVPSYAVVQIGPEQAAAKFKTKITITDVPAKANTSFDYEFQVAQPAFGIIRPLTPAVGFTGQDFAVAFSVVGMRRDKENLPKVTVSLKVLDDKGKSVLPEVKVKLQDLHDPILRDLTREKVIATSFQLFLNRPGQFTFEVEAHDDIGRRTAKMRLPLRVLEAP